MKKSYRISLLAIITLFIGFAIYLYYNHSQLERAAITEINKAKGIINISGKNNKYIQIEITNNKTGRTKLTAFNPNSSGSYVGFYNIGNITLKLMRNEKVVHTVNFILNKDQEIKFEAYDNEIRKQQ